MKLLFVALSSLTLVACGGSDPQDAAATPGVPSAVLKTGKPTGAGAIAVHMYQALYGKAPSYALMMDYSAQATSDASALAKSLTSAFASTSHADLAKLVLDNLGVTATSVKAVNAKGQSEYAILLDAVQQIFAAFPTMRGQVILNMTNLLADLEADATYGGAAVGYNNQASANQTYATNPANTSPAAAPVGGASATTLMGGAKQGVAMSLSGTSSTLAGGNFGPFDGVGTAAFFHGPGGVTTDGTNLYVIDSLKIRKIEITTGAVTTLAGSGTFGSTDGVGAAATFYTESAITTDGTNLYVTSPLRKIVIATRQVSTLTAPTFGRAANITTDGTYLYSVGQGIIYMYSLATGQVTTKAFVPINEPSAITTDGKNLYAASLGNVYQIEIATGLVKALAGAVGSMGDNGYWDGIGASASFNKLQGITTDGTHLYVTDANANIRKIVIATGEVTTLAGPDSRVCFTSTYGTCPSGFVNGVGTAARFWGPKGITSNGTSLFVADSTNNAIRKIQ